MHHTTVTITIMENQTTSQDIDHQTKTIIYAAQAAVESRHAAAAAVKYNPHSIDDNDSSSRKQHLCHTAVAGNCRLCHLMLHSAALQYLLQQSSLPGLPSEGPPVSNSPILHV